MLIKAGLRRLAASSSLLWNPGRLSKPASRLSVQRSSYSTADGTSLDYSNLKPVDLSFIKFDGSPAKSPVLILHGLFGNKNNWRSLGRMISERSERDTYVFDVRNHGESPHSDEFTYPVIANDVMHFMRKHSIEKGVMLGHSLGGRAFSKLSFMQGDLVEKLVLVDVHPTHQIPANEYLSLKFCKILREATESLKSSPNKLTLSAARKAMDERLQQQIPDTFLRQFFLASLCERNNQVDWKFNFPVLTQFLVGELNKIVVDRPFDGPCLLIYGGKSVYFDESHFKSVLEIFPRMKFEMVPEGNHYLHITHYQEFLDILVPFLNSS